MIDRHPVQANEPEFASTGQDFVDAELSGAASGIWVWVKTLSLSHFRLLRPLMGQNPGARPISIAKKTLLYLGDVNLPVTHRHIFLMVSQSFQHVLLHWVA